MDFVVPSIYSRMLKSPHILIAGTTGSGKSVALNSLLYSAMIEAGETGKNAAFTYIDLKMIELVDWRDLPNCSRYVDRPEDAPKALKDAVDSMYARYKVMQNQHIKETTEGHVYIVVDELADFVNDKGCLERLVTLGRLGRAAHYHLILCTQDPSRATLSAPLLQNMTCRVALRTKSPIESRQIVGVAGAEKLPEHGRALLDMDGAVENVEIPMVSEKDIKTLIETLRNDEIHHSSYTSKQDVVEDDSNDNSWLFRPPMTTEEKLRERLSSLERENKSLRDSGCGVTDKRLQTLLNEARSTIARLNAENEELRKQPNSFSDTQKKEDQQQETNAHLYETIANLKQQLEKAKKGPEVPRWKTFLIDAIITTLVWLALILFVF